MRFSSFKYLCRQGWHNMLQNRLMTLASVGVLTACLLIMGVAALLSANVNAYVDNLISFNEVEFFFQPDADEATCQAQYNQIIGMDNVTNVTFVTKTQALEEQKNWMGDNGDLLQGFEGADNPENPLPMSVRVTLTDLERSDETVAAISAIIGDNLYSVATLDEVTDTLVSLKDIVTWIGYVLVAVLGVVSIVVISNTIRLTVFARRKEINIMKFVGATNAFIRLPFFVEGVTVGTLAGSISTAIICGAYAGLLKWLETPALAILKEFTRIMLPLSAIWLPLLGGFVLFGSLLGGVGCASSIRKHLKV